MSEADAAPGLDLPTRLEMGAVGFGESTYGDLRRAGAGWIRGGGSGGEGLGEALESLEPLLSRSFLLGQPNLAGMGVAAWDLAVATPGEALWERQLERTRRMIGRSSPLARLDEDEAPRDRADDVDALVRGADLLEAMQRLDQATAQLPEEAPSQIRDPLARLRGELEARLNRERRHHRQLDRALKRVDPTDPEAVARLRGQPVTTAETPAAIRLPAAPRDPYGAALETVLAREPAPASPEVAALQARVTRVAETALAADPNSAASKRLTEQARRLFAQETALTAGQPTAASLETTALRRALADRPGTSERPTQGDLTPQAGLPEVPILSSRGEKAKVIGYLRAGERVVARQTGATHVQVAVPGQARPGWIPTHLLTTARLEARGPLSPDATGPALRPPAGGGVPELARLAALVARETGQSAAALLARAIEDPTFARELPARVPRHAQGEAMTLPQGPVVIDRVEVDGLIGAPEVARIVDAALARLPHVLERRLADAAVRSRMRGETNQVSVALTVDRSGDAGVQADVLANRMAEALVRQQSAQIGTLHLGVRSIGGADIAPQRALLSRLASEDVEGIAGDLAAERRLLDATQQARLAQFFGDDFKDVLIFAGPMAGALARSLDAEAITHGRMIFFDPKHFRPDSPRGEALLAHELAHTRQDDDRDVRVKEAEALATEAAWLDWVKPGEAPFTYALDLASPAAAAAADVAERGVMRAQPGREVAQSEGPRKEVASQEKKVEVVMQAVRELLNLETDLEGQRLGALRRLFNRMTS